MILSNIQHSQSDGNLPIVNGTEGIDRRMRIAKKEIASLNAQSPKLLNNLSTSPTLIDRSLIDRSFSICSFVM